MSLIRASLFLTLAELFFNFSGYITRSALTRILGPEDYGRYGIIITFSTLVVVLIGRGIPIAMSKQLSEVITSRPQLVLPIKVTAAKIQVVLILAASLIYWLLSPVFAWALNDSSLTPLFRLSTLTIPTFAAASFYIYYFNGLQQFGRSSLTKLSRGIFKIGLVVSLGMLFSISGAVWGHALTPLAVFIFAWLIDTSNSKFRTASNKSSTKTESSPQEVDWKSLLGFAWPVILFMIFYELMISIDLYMVKAILGSDSQAGFYDVALTISRIPYHGFYFLTIILLPKISQILSNKKTQEAQRIVQKAFRFLLMILIPGVALLSIFASSAITLFSGNDYLEATGALQIIAFGMGFLTIFYILAFVLKGAGENHISMRIAFMGGLVNSLLNFFLIQKWGLPGAAIATSLTSFLVMILAIYFTKRKIGSFLPGVDLVKYLLATGVISLLALNLPPGKFIFLIWSILLMGLYLTLLWILRAINLEDGRYLKNNFLKRKP